MTETAVIVGTILGGYVFLYGIEFTWKLLFQAPPALDAEGFQENETLRSQIQAIQNHMDPAEEHHLRTARDLVKKLSSKEKGALKYLWTNGQIKAHLGERGEPNPSQLQIPEMLPNDARNVLGDLSSTGLVSSRHDKEFAGPFVTWEIAPGYRNAIGKILFENEATGHHAASGTSRTLQT